MSRPVVVLELAGQTALARDLAAGGVFVPGHTLAMNEECDLVLRGGGRELTITAQCVWVDGTRGSGLQLIGCDADMKQQIAEMAEVVLEPRTSSKDIVPVAPRTSSKDIVPVATRTSSKEIATEPRASTKDIVRPAVEPRASTTDIVRPAGESRASTKDIVRPAAKTGETDGETVDDDEAVDHDETVDEDESSPERKIALNIHERLRGLTLVQQLKVAQHGEVGERVVLERMYGKNVWDALLRNPRVTGPEVARIARMGALPRPQLELIVSNGAWLQIPEIRRALLSNTRLQTDQILRVLRLLPKHELKLAAMQTAYPHAVRDAAKRMLKEAAGG